MSYLIPAAYTGMSSRDAHLRRNPPSGEPGTDYYMPTGTPLGAPARCRVVNIGGGIAPATGRFVLLDDGVRWMRALHLLEWLCRPGDELEPGETFALSGASGYGSEFFGEPSRNDAFWRDTGGDHVHMTAFKGRAYTFGASGTVDFHALTGGKVAGGGIQLSAIPTTGDPEMFLFYAGTLSPSNAMLATYDGRKLKCRPTVGTEAIALIAALPSIPRVQLSADQVVDLAAQGGYVWDAANGVGLYDGVPSYRPPA